MIFENVVGAIGKTPLIRLKNLEKELNLNFELYAKLERSNPSGSIKDRAAWFIVKDGIKKNLINEQTVLLEATSGNTGISIAMIAASLNLKCKIFMPSSASKERRLMMEAYGAEVVLVDSGGMAKCVELVEEFAKTNINSFIVHQFENESNIKAHFEGTSLEIINDLGQNPDYFLAGFGTAGTLIGNAKRFKQNGKTIVIGVEPLSSPLVTSGKAASHKIQGIGANFVPSLYDEKLVDKVVDVSDEDAYKFTKMVARKEGMLVGISSGAALAGLNLIKNEIKPGSKVVLIFPDNGERYLSVEGLYD